MNNKKDMAVVDTVDRENKKLRLMIKPFSHKILQKAQMIYNVCLTSLIKDSVSGRAELFSRQQLEQHLSNLDIWTDRDAKRFLQLQLEIRELEFKLAQDGLSEKDGKVLAFDIKTKRAALLALYGRRTQFDSITMESMAENKKFNFLVAECTVLAKDNTPFFANVDDYEVRQNEQAAIDAATAVAGILYGYDQSTEANLPENKWLMQFGFVNDQGKLINSDGHLIDIDGRLINEDGRFIDTHGNLVDDQGRFVDNDGNFVVHSKSSDKRRVAKRRKK